MMTQGPFLIIICGALSKIIPLLCTIPPPTSFSTPKMAACISCLVDIIFRGHISLPVLSRVAGAQHSKKAENSLTLLFLSFLCILKISRSADFFPPSLSLSPSLSLAIPVFGAQQSMFPKAMLELQATAHNTPKHPPPQTSPMYHMLFDNCGCLQLQNIQSYDKASSALRIASMICLHTAFIKEIKKRKIGHC